MLRSLLEVSLRQRSVVIALAVAFVVYGAFAAQRAAFDVFPDFVPPEVVIQTEAPGFPPEQIEALVTRPLEAAISGLGRLQALRSESIQGLSVVTVVFEEGTDVFNARQLLNERLTEVAARLPQGVQVPRMSPLTSATMDVLKIGLVSDRLSPMQLRTLADWTVRPRLLMVPGVARVNIFGGDVRQFQIQIDPARLRAFGLGLPEMVAAARAATTVRGAGFVETANQRITLESMGEARTPETLGQAVIGSHEGAPLRLEDVATVTEAAAPKFGDALVQGGPGVLLTLSAQYGANTLDVTKAIESALQELAPLFQHEEVKLLPRLHRPANFIETAFKNVRFSLLLGASLVIAVVFLFLRDVRTALISLSAIPLSLLTALIVLERFGVTLNTMSLGGLVIALGEVVDDAIIDVENIVRRLRENRARVSPRPAFQVVLEASLEVRGAVVYATFCVALVFLPLLGLTGLQGKFFAPLAASYLLAILASLAVALTVTPALCLTLLARAPGSERELRLQTRLRETYRRLLEGALARPARILAAVGLACVSAFSLLPFLGGELLPEFREGHLVLQVSAAPGTSLGEMLRIGGRISQALLALPYVDTVEQQVGRAEQGEDTWGPNRSEFHVELRPDVEDTAVAMNEVRELLGTFPGIQSEVLTFLGDRISETISGETAAVVVNLYGENLDLLDRSASDVARTLTGVAGASDVHVNVAASAPRVTIEPRRDRLAAFGLQPGDVLDQIQTAYEGSLVAQVHEGDRSSDVVVILHPASRRDPSTVPALDIRGGDGTLLPLRTVAEIRSRSGREEILHEGGRRRQTVTCNVTGTDVASFVASAEEAIRSQVTLPPELTLSIGGEARARAEAARELALNAAMGALGVLLLLSIVAGHWRNVLLLAVNAPLALAGGVLAAAAATALGAGAGISLGSLVGFVTLFGVTLRNAIMMLSHYRRLVEEDGEEWGMATAVRGAGERVVPIVMTALVTALGLLPIALSAQRPGGEIDGPMAIVILGGLVSSTTLNLFLMPLLCLRFGVFRPLVRPGSHG